LVCAFHQVAERALYLFYNQRFVVLLDQNMNELPVFIGSIVQYCSWLEPHSPSCSILRHTGSDCQSKLLALTTCILGLSHHAQHAAEVRVVASPWTLLFLPISFRPSDRTLKDKQLQQAAMTMIEQAVLIHPPSSSFHSCVING
jgi:hypothetical protein